MRSFPFLPLQSRETELNIRGKRINIDQFVTNGAAILRLNPPRFLLWKKVTTDIQTSPVTDMKTEREREKIS